MGGVGQKGIWVCIFVVVDVACCRPSCFYFVLRHDDRICLKKMYTTCCQAYMKFNIVMYVSVLDWQRIGPLLSVPGVKCTELCSLVIGRKCARQMLFTLSTPAVL